MSPNKSRAGVLAAMLLLLAAGRAAADTPADFARRFDAEARKLDPGQGDASAARGERFFKDPHGGEWSCSSCHTANPLQTGRHATTGKTIAPLAPAANAERFTSPAKVEKWFRRNCKDVLSRECTPAEKGDVLAYLRSLQ